MGILAAGVVALTTSCTGGRMESTLSSDGGRTDTRRDALESDGGTASDGDGAATTDGGVTTPPSDAAIHTDANGIDASSSDGGSGLDGHVVIADAATADGGATDAGHPTSDAGPTVSCVDPSVLPPLASPAPPTDRCTYMDWDLSPDGFYLISQFGTSADDTTWGRGTSCMGLRVHYRNWCCQYDRHTRRCLDGGTPSYDTCSWTDPRIPNIPWIQGTVDYDYWTVWNRVARYYFATDGSLKPPAETDAFDHPEYFYVAGAQRFNCGSTLRVTNTENGRCIVTYVEDGGPGSYYEQAGLAGRRIIDSSPAVHRFLENRHSGVRVSSLLYVEWGMPGDRPGDQCTPCESTPAMQGTESHRTSFDLNHFDAPNCRGSSLYP